MGWVVHRALAAGVPEVQWELHKQELFNFKSIVGFGGFTQAGRLLSKLGLIYVQAFSLRQFMEG